MQFSVLRQLIDIFPSLPQAFCGVIKSHRGKWNLFCASSLFLEIVPPGAHQPQSIYSAFPESWVQVPGKRKLVSIIPALRKLRQEDHNDLKVSGLYTESLSPQTESYPDTDRQIWRIILPHLLSSTSDLYCWCHAVSLSDLRLHVYRSSPVFVSQPVLGMLF